MIKSSLAAMGEVNIAYHRTGLVQQMSAPMAQIEAGSPIDT